jgi:hypothetical protein
VGDELSVVCNAPKDSSGIFLIRWRRKPSVMEWWSVVDWLNLWIVKHDKLNNFKPKGLDTTCDDRSEDIELFGHNGAIIHW